MITNKSLLKKISAVAVSSALCGLCFVSPRISSAEEQSILYGSWNENTTNHAGSVVEFQVKGSSGISFDLSDYDSFCFQVDGGEPQKVNPGWYKLSKDKHEICLYTESIADRKSGVTFNKADLYGGSLSVSSKEQYLFIGDSLWEGTNILVTEKDLNGRNKTFVSSFTNSIPFQICKNMNTVPVTVAAPGSGVVMKDIFSTVEDMAFKTGINATPTKIFISVGTNDKKLGIPNYVERAEMQHLVDTTIENFPDSEIYMLVPFYGQCYYTSISELRGITMIDTHGWPIEYTDGIHPTAESAKFAADVITYILQNPTVTLDMSVLSDKADEADRPASQDKAKDTDQSAVKGQTGTNKQDASQGQTDDKMQADTQDQTDAQDQTILLNPLIEKNWTFVQDEKVTRMQERFLGRLKNLKNKPRAEITDPE